MYLGIRRERNKSQRFDLVKKSLQECYWTSLRRLTSRPSYPGIEFHYEHPSSLSMPFRGIEAA